MSTTEQPKMSPDELSEHWRTNPPPYISMNACVPHDGDLDMVLESFREAAEIVMRNGPVVELFFDVSTPDEGEQLDADPDEEELEDGGQYTWVTNDGNEATGNEDEFFAAVHRGELRYVNYDANTGLYTYVPTERTES